MNIVPFFALASSETIVDAVVWLVGIGLIAWLLWWLIDFAGIPVPFSKVAKVIVALVAVILLIRIVIRVTGLP